MNKANLQPLCTANHLLAEFTLILTVSYHPPTKIGMIHALLYRYFRICSDWTKFHLELVKLMDVFNSNSYPENFSIIVLERFWITNIEYKKKKVIIIPKKPLLLGPSYIGPLLL